MLFEHNANADSKCRCARFGLYQAQTSPNPTETHKAKHLVLGNRQSAEAAQVKLKGPAGSIFAYTKSFKNELEMEGNQE